MICSSEWQTGRSVRWLSHRLRDNFVINNKDMICREQNYRRVRESTFTVHAIIRQQAIIMMSHITGGHHRRRVSLLVSRSWIDRRTSVRSTCSHVADVHETSRSAKERQKQRPLLATGALLPTWIMCLSYEMTQHIFSARHREEKHHVSFKRSIHDHDVCLGGTTRPSQRDISRGKKRRDINPSSSAKESTNIISLDIDGVGRDRRSDLDHPLATCDSPRRDVTSTLCQAFLWIRLRESKGMSVTTSMKKEQDTNKTSPPRSVVVRQKQQSTKRNVDDAVDDGGGDEDNDGAGAVFPGCLNSDLRSDSMNRRDKRLSVHDDNIMISLVSRAF